MPYIRNNERVHGLVVIGLNWQLLCGGVDSWTSFHVASVHSAKNSMLNRDSIQGMIVASSAEMSIELNTLWMYDLVDLRPDYNTLFGSRLAGSLTHQITSLTVFVSVVNVTHSNYAKVNFAYCLSGVWRNKPPVTYWIDLIHYTTLCNSITNIIIINSQWATT